MAVSPIGGTLTDALNGSSRTPTTRFWLCRLPSAPGTAHRGWGSSPWPSDRSGFLRGSPGVVHGLSGGC